MQTRATSGSGVTPPTVEVVIEIPRTLGIKDMESVEPTVSPVKPSPTKRTLRTQ